MNVYDFDGTIYKGDSSVDFYLFSLKKDPKLIRFLPKQIIGAFLFLLKIKDKTEFKECYFSFVKGINTKEMVNLFWQKNQNKIQSWYLKQSRSTDIIISASPDFLVKPICKSFGIINIIASEVNEETGCFLSKNCKGEEKANRLLKEFNIVKIDSFYSDSLSDKPLADISKKAYLVNNGKITEWKN